jgi:hypothetical protein
MTSYPASFDKNLALDKGCIALGIKGFGMSSRWYILCLGSRVDD